jgi:hypothetical protein
VWGASKDYTSQVDTARTAATNYLLSLLQTEQPLSETASALQTLGGTATALQGELERLGLAGDEAARMIRGGITKTVTDLGSNLNNNLQRGINAATGQGYLNDLLDLMQTVETGRQDIQDLVAAGAKNVDASLLDRYLSVQAQKIVDDAGLVGKAFEELTRVFPSLSGVVQPATAALESFTQSIGDFLAQLSVGSLSPLSPTGQLSAARSYYESTLQGVRGGDVGARSSITEAASSYLTVARDYYASSGAYQDIFSNVTSQLAGLPSALGAPTSAASLLASAGLAGGQAPAANDNAARQNFVDLMQVNHIGFSALEQALREEIGELRAEIAQLTGLTAQQANAPNRPGRRMAS